MGLTGVRNQFSPISLFSAGEQGAWYDPSDMSSMYQDSAGTTPVTAVEQPVGLLLDKRYNLLRGTDITNGGFDSDTTWTKGTGWAISGGTATYTSGIGAALTQTHPETLAVGDWVEVTLTVVAVTGGFIYPRIAGTIQDASQSTNSTGAKRWLVRITAVTDQTVGVVTGNTPSGWVIDNLSIRKVAGNHLYQDTSTSRPVLKALYNRLTKTEDFANAAWSKTNVTIAAGITDPIGGTNAARITATGAGAYAHQTFTNGSAVISYTRKIWIRRVTGTGTIRLYNPDGTTWTDITGQVTTSWQEFTTGASNIAAAALCYGHTAYLATSGDVVDIAFPDLRATNDFALDIPTYQRVNTTSDYATAGFKMYLSFDGVDDALGTTFAAGTLGASMESFQALSKTSAKGVAVYNNSTTGYFGVWDAGVGGTASTAAGTPTYKVNNAAVVDDRIALSTALGTHSNKVLEIGSLVLNTGTWTGLATGGYTNFQIAGRLYGWVLCPSQTAANQARLRTYLGTKCGISL